MRPERAAFSRRELRLIDRLRTPLQVQRYLNGLPYNTEPPPGRATLRSFRGVVRHHTAHCLEAALAAAVILEQHGYPPLVLSFESIDDLDHVLFAVPAPRTLGLGRPITRSRAARPQTGIPHRPRSRSELRRPVHRLQRPGHRLCRRRSGGAGRVRLETFGAERLEGRALAVELSAPPHPLVERTDQPTAPLVPSLSGDLRTQARTRIPGIEKWTELPEF